MGQTIWAGGSNSDTWQLDWIWVTSSLGSSMVSPFIVELGTRFVVVTIQTQNYESMMTGNSSSHIVLHLLLYVVIMLLMLTKFAWSSNIWRRLTSFTMTSRPHLFRALCWTPFVVISISISLMRRSLPLHNSTSIMFALLSMLPNFLLLPPFCYSWSVYFWHGN